LWQSALLEHRKSRERNAAPGDARESNMRLFLFSQPRNQLLELIDSSRRTDEPRAGLRNVVRTSAAGFGRLGGGERAEMRLNSPNRPALNCSRSIHSSCA